MRNILIIYPHWPPSNLAGVHRPRLITNFLPAFNWHPVVLTVAPEYYEEVPDPDLEKTVNKDTEVYKVKAFQVPGNIRLIGDIGLRGMPFLYRQAKKIIRSRQINFIWIPVPSYYTAVLGRLLYNKFKIPYGIDYIDPWYNGIPGADKKFSRAWLSNRLAGLLEPFAVKKASLISGVSVSYYQYLFDKGWVSPRIPHAGMPYGFDPKDHQVKTGSITYPWEDIAGCKPLIYAGAFLPESHYFIRHLFQAIAVMQNDGSLDRQIHLYFLGTGNYPGKSIADYADEYGIGDRVHEYRQRFPFLQILNFLNASYGVMVIGTTEKHYTASKIYQAVLSEKPVFAVLHHESTAVHFLRECRADSYLVTYNEDENERLFHAKLAEQFYSFAHKKKAWGPVYQNLEKYSARNSAKQLVDKIALIGTNS